MPRHAHHVPKYRRRPGRRYSSGRREPDQAVVTIEGVDHYLGPYNTTASKHLYDRLIAEWLVAGRAPASQTAEAITVAELCAAYWKFAVKHYVKHGQSTRVTPSIKCALRYVLAWYAKEPAADFGPKKLKAIREHMIGEKLSRKYINDHIDRIKRMFKWGVSEELLPHDAYERLRTVPSLSKGRSEARETERILPVDDAIVATTLPFLSPVVAAMVQLQRLTGGRPQDVCNIRPVDLDRSQNVWLYRPTTYKTEHLGDGGERVLFLGPRAQAILAPYLDRDAASYCFQPCEAEHQRRAQRHSARKTPLNQGNRPGTNRLPARERPPGPQYSTESYRRAIHRACDQAFPPPPPLAKRTTETAKGWADRLDETELAQLRTWQSEHRWSPNQLRHAAATDLRRGFGIESARVILGHANVTTTQIYAERDLEAAMKIAEMVC